MFYPLWLAKTWRVFVCRSSLQFAILDTVLSVYKNVKVLSLWLYACHRAVLATLLRLVLLHCLPFLLLCWFSAAPLQQKYIQTSPPEAFLQVQKPTRSSSPHVCS